MNAKSEENNETDKSLLLKLLGKTAKLRILDFLIDNPLHDFSKKEIIEETKMSKPTFYKYWPDIEEKNLVEESRKYGKTVLYKLNTENPTVKKLIELDEQIMTQYTPTSTS